MKDFDDPKGYKYPKIEVNNVKQAVDGLMRRYDEIDKFRNRNLGGVGEELSAWCESQLNGFSKHKKEEFIEECSRHVFPYIVQQISKKIMAPEEEVEENNKRVSLEFKEKDKDKKSFFKKKDKVNTNEDKVKHKGPKK